MIKNVFLFFRYQVLAGVIEQRLLEPLLHKHKLMLSAISFAVRTGNTFLGSLLWEFITLIWHNPFAKNCSSSLNDSPFSTLPWQVGGLCSMARTTIMLGSKRAAAISYFIVKFGLVLVHYKAIHKLGKLTPVWFPLFLGLFGYLYTHRKTVQAELTVCILYSFSPYIPTFFFFNFFYFSHFLRIPL